MEERIRPLKQQDLKPGDRVVHIEHNWFATEYPDAVESCGMGVVNWHLVSLIREISFDGQCIRPFNPRDHVPIEKPAGWDGPCFLYVNFTTDDGTTIDIYMMQQYIQRPC